MPIRFRCPSCRQLSGIATRKAGQSVRCPRCQAKIIVPHDDMADALWDFDDEDEKPDNVEDVQEQETVDTRSSEERALRHEWEELRDQQSGTQDEQDEPARDEMTADSFNEQSANESGANDDDRDKETVAASAMERKPPGGGDDDEGVTFRKYKSDLDEMDLTPMVDCTFLLLIFFMITASFSLQKSIQVPDPNPDKKGAAQSLQTLDDFKEDSIIVEIDERNSIIVDDEPLAAIASLPQVLSNKMRLEKKNELMLSAHDSAWHDSVIRVIDAANEVGMQKIRMASYRGGED